MPRIGRMMRGIFYVSEMIYQSLGIELTQNVLLGIQVEDFFFFLFRQIQRVHELHHISQAHIGIIGGENDAVDAKCLFGTLKSEFGHIAAGCHHHILVLEVVRNLVLHLHLVVLDPCKAVVHSVYDEREELAEMTENHSQLGELVEGAVQNQAQRRLHSIQSEAETWRRIHIAHILHILVVGSLRMNIDGTAQLFGFG